MMKKLETLTKEQEDLIPIIRQKWLDEFYNNQEIDKQKAIEQITWLYEFCGKNKPTIFFMDSPLGSQIIANIGANIRDNIGANIGDNIGANIKYNTLSYYGNVSDYGWVGFYDYFQSLNHFLEYDWSNFVKFKTLLQTGIYELLTFENVCIVSLKPKVKQDERNRLHCEDSPAVLFKDEFAMYFWHGIYIPEKWIMNKESITKEDIMKETNAEKRRCLQEILGSNYAKLLDIELIDSDTDQYSYPIELYRTKEKDSLIDEFIYFLHVTCPSTKREYYLCVPECKNCWEAKSWTFRNEKIEIRHGDCALVNLKKEFNQPIYES